MFPHIDHFAGSSREVWVALLIEGHYAKVGVLLRYLSVEDSAALVHEDNITDLYFRQVH